MTEQDAHRERQKQSKYNHLHNKDLSRDRKKRKKEIHGKITEHNHCNDKDLDTDRKLNHVNNKESLQSQEKISILDRDYKVISHGVNATIKDRWKRSRIEIEKTDRNKKREREGKKIILDFRGSPLN